MKRFARYALPYKRFFIFGPILIFCGAFGEVLLPRMAAELINSAVAGAQAQSLLSAGLPMFGVALFFAASTLAGNQLSTRASIHFSADVRKDAFAKIQSFSFPDLDRFQTGALVTRLTSDAAQLQQFTMQLLRMGIRCPTHLIGAVIMAFSMNIQLALVMLLLLPAMALSTFLIVRKALPRFKVMQERLDEINAKVSESISNVRLVKSLSREEYESSRFGDCAESLGSASLDANRVMLLQRLSMTFCMNAATIAVLWAGGAMGTMKAGDLAAFVGYVTQMLTSLMLFSNMLLTSSRAIVSAKRITEVLDSSGECDPENSSLSVANGSVEFKDITFRHQKGSLKPALEDLSLVIEPGQTVGLVGSAGSGKSTLAHMIPGLLNPDSGQALVDGKDILTYSLKGLRSAACVVLQSSILFSGTIAENLAWGKDGASMEEMRAAAHAAQADLFIDELPEGYETMLSQGGVNLSGGQRQRLCLARAILRSPKIIILDDAASAVDTVTEANIRRNLSSALPGATRVIIAQRIASVKDADKIFVLENGRLAGAGTHDELFESCGIYRDICMTQV